MFTVMWRIQEIFGVCNPGVDGFNETGHALLREPQPEPEPECLGRPYDRLTVS